MILAAKGKDKEKQKTTQKGFRKKKKIK